MDVRFLTNAHIDFYKGALERENAESDPYRKSLFYLLGLMPETRKNIADLYDFEKGAIVTAGLQKGWQTGTSMQVCRLAFNLFNGYTDEAGHGAAYTPYHLFCNSFQVYMFEAVKLRYSEYAQGEWT